MPEFPFQLEDRAAQARLEGCVDREGKIPRAVVELGDLAGRRVALPDVDPSGPRAAQLRAAGAAFAEPTATEDRPIERHVSFWGALHPDAPDADAALAAIEASLVPEGRIVLVHDYGRDEAARLLGGRDREERLIAWSSRKGWFLGHGFKLRVIHCWWTFDSLDEMSELLTAAFRDAGASLAAELRRPRLSHKVAVYHLRLG